jgi:hypothetical protein
MCLFHVGFDVGALNLNAKRILQRLEDTAHFILAYVVELEAVGSTIFDF